MEVKIGVQNVTREIVIDTDMEPEAVEKLVADAASGGTPLLALDDSKGRRVVVAADKLAYVEIGSPTSGQVGFRS